MKPGIVIILPGMNYTYKEKLLIECTQKYIKLGYDIVNLDFSRAEYKNINSLAEAVEITKPIILDQVKDIIFEEYNDIVFISKSLGTACANWLEQRLNIKPRHFYLTPLPETIESIKDASRVIGMVIGTKDRFLDYKIMESFCLEKDIRYLIINNVGHGLKIDGDDLKTEKINKKIVEFFCS